jgi:hypothetical protein
MAIKIVQTINSISPTVSVAATSNPIALKSGYIRVSTGITAVHVEIGGNPIVTENSFFIPPYGTEVIKERIAKQQISGITTGSSTTIVTLPSNAGNPFAIGDFVTIENAQPSGINTVHRLVTSITDNTVTISADTSPIVGVITTSSATLSRSIKVGALADSSGTTLNITEIVQLVSE